eukprot:6198358-Pleurochrysis_carterae.AAC.5
MSRLHARARLNETSFNKDAEPSRPAPAKCSFSGPFLMTLVMAAASASACTLRRACERSAELVEAMIRPQYALCLARHDNAEAP